MNFTTVKTRKENCISVQKDKTDHIQRMRNQNGITLLNTPRELEHNEARPSKFQELSFSMWDTILSQTTSLAWGKDEDIFKEKCKISKTCALSQEASGWVPLKWESIK